MVNGYKEQQVIYYQKMLVEDARLNAIDAESLSLFDTADHWDYYADEYSKKTLEEISCKMIYRGVSRNG